MKKKWIILCVEIVVLLGCIAALLFLFQRDHQQKHIVINGTEYSRDITALDLSNTAQPELDKIAELKKLTSLNLENTGITREDYYRLQAALPQCRIQWLVPFQGNHYPLSTTSIAFSSLTADEIDTLRCLPELTDIDARGCTNYDALMELSQLMPHCAIQYQVYTGSDIWPNDATAITYALEDGQQLKDAMKLLPMLTQVDARGCGDLAAIKALQQEYPDCDFLYTVPIAGEAYDRHTSTLTLAKEDFEDLAKGMPYLPELQSVTLTGCFDDPEAVYSLIRQYPQVDFTWNFALFGVEVCNKDTFVDLSEIPMENTDALESALKYFTNLEKVDMVHCGISNEEMLALNQRHENTSFVWTVMVSVIELRTDITNFMPYKYGYKINNEHAKNLKYCTEIMCMDLGHQDIVDTDFMKTMTKMEYLLLADTDISDLSFCENMPELKYLEIFMTKVRDISPLAHCTKLEDINMAYIYPKNVDSLCGLPNLKNLWMRGYEYTEQQRQLKAALPNTRIVFSHGPSTAEGWRQLPNYFTMRDILGMHYMTD